MYSLMPSPQPLTTAVTNVVHLPAATSPNRQSESLDEGASGQVRLLFMRPQAKLTVGS